MTNKMLKAVVYPSPVHLDELLEAVRNAQSQFYMKDISLANIMTNSERELIELFIGYKIQSLYITSMPRLTYPSVRCAYPELYDIFEYIEDTIGRDAFTMQNTHYPSLMNGIFEIRILDSTYIATSELYSGGQ